MIYSARAAAAGQRSPTGQPQQGKKKASDFDFSARPAENCVAGWRVRTARRAVLGTPVRAGDDPHTDRTFSPPAFAAPAPVAVVRRTRRACEVPG